MKRDLRALPITDDDATIARALESASIPTLMMSLVHVTGDASVLRGPIRPRRAVMGEVHGGLPEAERAEVRRQALAALRAYRDGGCKLPPPPARETVREMMSFMVGEPVSDEYVPMMLEEMELDGVDVRGQRWDSVPEARRREFHVLVIGAGMSGILAAIRLEQAGIPYTVVEKNPAVGGTWYENRYPGCRVDVANHFYSYSFEPNDWVEFYSQRNELFSLLRAGRHRLRCAAEDPLRARSDERALGRERRALGRAPAHEGWRGGAPHRERDRERSGSAEPAEHSEHPGAGALRGRELPLRRVGPGAGSRRQARGRDRHRRERLPARARGREAGGAAHSLPALARRG